MGTWTGQTKRETSECVFLLRLFLWPSITQVGSPSFFHSTVCSLTQITNYLFVTYCSTNKRSCVRESGRRRGKQQNDERRELRANRQQTLTRRKRRQKYREMQKEILVCKQNKLTFCSFAVKLGMNVTIIPSPWCNQQGNPGLHAVRISSASSPSAGTGVQPDWHVDWVWLQPSSERGRVWAAGSVPSIQALSLQREGVLLSLLQSCCC